MSDQDRNSNSPTTRPARYVRFTPEEYAQLVEDEKRADRSVQDLLKNAYFKQGRVIILMSDSDKDQVIAQIRRIGNNVNQIAKRINSGFQEGFTPEIAEVRTMLTSLVSWLTGKYGPYRGREA